MGVALMLVGVPSVAAAAPVACGATLTVDTILGGDLSCSGTALHIGASGVTLDLHGYTISGDGSADSRGINNLGFDGVTIRNGTITGFDAGVWFSGGGVTDSEITGLRLVGNGRGVFLNAGSDRNHIHHNSVTDSAVSGVALNGSDENRIVRNALAGNVFAGVELFAGSSDNRVAGNDVSGGGAGVFQSVTSGSQVLWNRISDSGSSGIVLFDADDGVVKGNKVVGSANAGVSVSGSQRNVIKRNTLKMNSGFGVYLGEESNQNDVLRNVVAANGRGIRVALGSSSNTVARNAVYRNPNRGIEVLDAGSVDNKVTSNLVAKNGYGIQVFGAVDTLLRNNVVKRNVYDGIIVNQGSVGTIVVGNQAHGNGTSGEDGPWDGIDVDAAGTTITDNTANWNRQFGISAVPGVVDGAGNTATGNGNPLQCNNIACG